MEHSQKCHKIKKSFDMVTKRCYIVKKALEEKWNTPAKHFKDLENHFENIFKIIKERVLEFRTYTMYFDTIEYQNIELIWSSGCDHELKLMEVDVSYSQMNDPKYLQSIAEEVNAFNEAEENCEDMQAWIEKRREENKDGSKPKIVGSIPDFSKSTIH